MTREMVRLDQNMTKLVRDLYISLLKNAAWVMRVEYEPTGHIAYIKLGFKDV